MDQNTSRLQGLLANLHSPFKLEAHDEERIRGLILKVIGLRHAYENQTEKFLGTEQINTLLSLLSTVIMGPIHMPSPVADITLGQRLLQEVLNKLLQASVQKLGIVLCYEDIKTIAISLKGFDWVSGAAFCNIVRCGCPWVEDYKLRNPDEDAYAKKAAENPSKDLMETGKFAMKHIIQKIDMLYEIGYGGVLHPTQKRILMLYYAFPTSTCGCKKSKDINSTYWKHIKSMKDSGQAIGNIKEWNIHDLLEKSTAKSGSNLSCPWICPAEIEKIKIYLELTWKKHLDVCLPKVTSQKSLAATDSDRALLLAFADLITEVDLWFEWFYDFVDGLTDEKFPMEKLLSDSKSTTEARYLEKVLKGVLGHFRNQTSLKKIVICSHATENPSELPSQIDTRLEDNKTEEQNGNDSVASLKLYDWLDEVFRRVHSQEIVPRGLQVGTALEKLTTTVRSFQCNENRLMQKIIGLQRELDQRSQQLDQARDKRGMYEEGLNRKLHAIESEKIVECKKLERLQRQVAKSKEDWEKKLQKMNAKLDEAKTHNERTAREHDTLKLDFDLTISDLKASKNQYNDLKEFYKEEDAKYQTIKKEYAELQGLARSLRSNEKIVKDRIDNAVQCAVQKVKAAKDLKITQLEAQNAQFRKGKEADTQTIIELSQAKNRLQEQIKSRAK